MTTLLESLLSSEFKFGFELEAYSALSEEEKNKYVSDNTIGFFSKQSLSQEYKDKLIKYFSHWFGNNLKIQYDDSLKTDNTGFEFATPIMSFTPLNIQKSIDFLNNLNNSEFKIYTDETCGFHIHFSFPTMTTEDMVWIVCHISYDESLQKLLKFFTTKNDKTFKFFNKKFAKVGFLKDIKTSINTNNWSKLNELLSNDKYRLIRIHPDDNLEWRGPRNFLNEPEIQTIKEFFLQFHKIIMEIIKIIDKKEINGISRENFFKLVNISNIDSSKSLNKKYDNNKKIVNILLKNPLKLAKIPEDAKLDFEQIIYELSYQTRDEYLIPLRYQHFNNTKVLKKIIDHNPSFINYVVNDFNTFLTKYDVVSFINSNIKLKPEVCVELLSIFNSNHLGSFLYAHSNDKKWAKFLYNKAVYKYLLKNIPDKKFVKIIYNNIKNTLS